MRFTRNRESLDWPGLSNRGEGVDGRHGLAASLPGDDLDEGMQ
jgi:hypothetical protein